MGRRNSYSATTEQPLPAPPKRAHRIRFGDGASLAYHYDLIGYGLVAREIVHAWERRGMVVVDRSSRPWVVRPLDCRDV